MGKRKMDIQVAIDELKARKEVIEKDYKDEVPEYHEALKMAVAALKVMQTMKKRGLQIGHIKEYAKFEDELVAKGYTFRSVLEARNKQEVIPLVSKVDPHYKCIGKMYYCKCGVAYFDASNNYCGNCGQKLRKE